ncbi:MAG: hypothetical protein CBD76_00610 [Pelagibacteraceae bacterium TMED216]|nr:MAG: hypothetical protein CBD76_00610 [Pelagibacteraceae bacterium TMED216]
MVKFLIMVPVFNDWESLKRLLINIDDRIKKIKSIEVKCLIINDCSTTELNNLPKIQNIKELKMINMLENKGHARCNAFGIRFLSTNNSIDFDHLILMDSDGEDRPEELNNLIDMALENRNISVVAKRIKRSEGFIFQLLYKFHKIMTILFTGKNINFGNYSCLTKQDVQILSNKSSLWSSFSGSVKRHIKSYNEINSIRGLRYFGPSKMSFYKLLIHSFSILGVFKLIVLARTTLLFIFFFISQYNNI